MNNKRKSFTERILSMLSSGRWVSAPRIAAVGGLCYTKRIHELRKRGVFIENEVQRGKDGVLRSRYRLVNA